MIGEDNRCSIVSREKEYRISKRGPWLQLRSRRKHYYTRETKQPRVSTMVSSCRAEIAKETRTKRSAPELYSIYHRLRSSLTHFRSPVPRSESMRSRKLRAQYTADSSLSLVQGVPSPTPFIHEPRNINSTCNGVEIHELREKQKM